MTIIGKVSTLRKWQDPDMTLFDFSAMSTNDPRISMVGGANRTFIDDDRRLRTAAANDMRFEKDGNGQRYWRMDPQSTNLVQYSGIPINHGVTNVTRTGSHVFAGYKMAKVAATSINTSSHYLIMNAGPKLAVGTILSAQCVLKAGEYRFATVQLVSGAVLATRNIDLITGELSTPDDRFKIEKLADGVFLVMINGVAAIDGTFATLLRVYPSQEMTGAGYAGDGVKGIFVGGGQIEQQPQCTSFIETEAASVTRVGERASVEGQNFPTMFNQSAFTFITDSIFTSKPAGTSVIAAISSPNSGIEFAYQATNAALGGVLVVRPPGAASLTTILTRAGTFGSERGRLGIRFDVDQYRGMSNGTPSGAPATLAPQSTADRINFGNFANAGAAMSVLKLCSFRMYRRALSDAEFSTLTTL